MTRRIALLLFVLSVSMCSYAQQGRPLEPGWTDKNNTERYAAYMLQVAYNEQGYWGAKVEVRQAGTKRVFVVQPGRIYHVECFDVSGLSDLPGEAMTNSPKAGDVYSPDRINEWISTLKSQYNRVVYWGVRCDHATADCRIEVGPDVHHAPEPK